MLALEISDLTVQFEGQDRPAVEAVSFALEEGRIAVMIGPNGSGKSTVLRAILGLVPFRGTVRVFGGPVGVSYRKIGYVPQRLTFDQTLPLTVREAIRMVLPRRPRGGDEESFRHVDVVLCLNRRLLGSGAPKKVLTPEAIASLFGATPALYLHHHELHRGRHEPPQGGSP